MVAAPSSAPPATVEGCLRLWGDTPWAWDYFAVMRRLEVATPAAPRWGRALRPSAETVRVAQEPSLAFAPASFSRFEPASATSPPRLRQHFFGYLGPNGPLPIHLSDFIRERALNHGDRTWLAFLDTFTHRFALHFYRAWSQARPAVGLDRPGDDAFRRHVGAFVGIGTPARQTRDAVLDDARLHFSGWLARRVHNAEGAESVLAAYFGVPVTLEQWVGHWMRLPRDEQTQLGTRALATTGGGGAQPGALGMGAMLGKSAWDRQHKVRLHLGPLTLEQYNRFLPSGNARPALQNWMQHLLGDTLAWDAALVLRRAEVPPMRLGAVSSAEGRTPRLGWRAWIGTRPRTKDAADVRIDGTAFEKPVSVSS